MAVHASAFEIVAARCWNLLNEGKSFHPIFSVGTFLLWTAPRWLAGDLAPFTALAAALPFLLLYIRYDFPLALRLFLWPPLLAAALLFGVPWSLWGLATALYFFFTVFLWGSLYYHLRIGTPLTNFTRFWWLVLRNADSTSGNAAEQLPKALLLLTVAAWALREAFPFRAGGASLASYLMLLAGTAVLAFWVERRLFTWRPREEGGPSRPVALPRSRRAVVVVIDGCRLDRLDEAATPFLDALRRRGTEFRAMETVYPARTVVCFSSMFTGTYPREHGVHSNLVLFLGLRCESIFDVLARHGRRGKLLGIAHLVDVFGPHVEAVTAVMPNDEVDGRIAARARAILAEERPDLLVVQLIAVDQTGHSRGALYPEYRRKIEEADRHVAAIYGALVEEGLADETLFLVCADHGQGDGIGGHGHLGQGERYVPFILSGPGVARGKRVEEPTSLVSVAPTLCAALGLPFPDRSRGRVLREAFTPPEEGSGERHERLVVLIPAWNEAETVGNVVRRIPREALARLGYATTILVIDDGSTDGTGEVARAAGADVVVRHERNRGLGAAVRTGLLWARTAGADAAVLIDADDEYPPEAIPDLLVPIRRGRAEYVLGSRFRFGLLGPVAGMRTLRRCGNIAFTLLTALLARRRLSDAQTGLRAFSREALARFRIVHDYNYAQVLTLNLCRQGLRLVEVPIGYRFRRSGRSFIRYPVYVRRVLPAIWRELRSPAGGGVPALSTAPVGEPASPTGD